MNIIKSYTNEQILLYILNQLVPLNNSELLLGYSTKKLIHAEHSRKDQKDKNIIKIWLLQTIHVCNHIV